MVVMRMLLCHIQSYLFSFTGLSAPVFMTGVIVSPSNIQIHRHPYDENCHFQKRNYLVLLCIFGITSLKGETSLIEHCVAGHPEVKIPQGC